MVTLKDLTNYINNFLQIDRFKDYCPNGLQVDGRDKVERIVTGVTASQALLDTACEKQADVILVHHGYFWRNEDPRIIGIKRKRLTTLLQNEIGLMAYHLPLDAHPEVGNNAQLANLLEIEIDGVLRSEVDSVCGNVGHLSEPMDAGQFKQKI